MTDINAAGQWNPTRINVAGAFASVAADPAQLPPGTYATPATGRTFAGAIYSLEDMNRQFFPTGADFVDFSNGGSYTRPSPEVIEEKMNLARQMISQGREPILHLAGILLHEDKGLKPDAAQMLDDLIARYPDVMRRPGLVIEAVDEIFLTKQFVEGKQTDESLRKNADDAIETIELIRSRLPESKIAITACPEVWRTDLRDVGALTGDPRVVEQFMRVLPHLDIAAVDPYAWTLDPQSMQAKLQAATEYADFIDNWNRNNGDGRHVDKWVIPQGFVPHELNKDPATWSPEQAGQFKDFMREMFRIAEEKYDGTLVWGATSAVDGLGSVHARGTEDLQQIYIDAAILIGGGIVPATGPVLDQTQPGGPGQSPNGQFIR